MQQTLNNLQRRAAHPRKTSSVAKPSWHPSKAHHTNTQKRAGTPLARESDLRKPSANIQQHMESKNANNQAPATSRAPSNRTVERSFHDMQRSSREQWTRQRHISPPRYRPPAATAASYQIEQSLIYPLGPFRPPRAGCMERWQNQNSLPAPHNASSPALW
jgi:hypothetical protein